MTAAQESNPTIPIVDISRAFEGTDADRTKVAQDLALACRRVGFVYITGHGIPPETIEKTFAVSKQLFGLPYEDKMKAPHPPGGAVHRGYSYPGQEKVSQATSDDEEGTQVKALRQIKDCKESYEIGSENDPEQTNVWLPEDTLPGFRSFTTELYWSLFATGREILKLISRGIGLTDEEYLLHFHSGNGNQLRLLHYPPIPAGEVERKVATRMPAHTDWGTITLLFQDSCGGLEVEDPNTPGTFLPATPVANALIMNVGDLLMRWSNDYLKSTSHRVSLPPLSDRFSGPNRLTRERYSIVYFIAPDPDARVECLPSCASEENPPRYEGIRWEDYRLMRASTQY
ncbi:MAG: hypothetical protein M1836_007976 [Candelina mexicana]|nr:MAG: hypothetical protein M1836_007976 [Candelina mexicana]